MRSWSLECARCETGQESFAATCPSCGAPLLVAPEPARGSAPADLLVDVGAPVTLGEGGTPLLPGPRGTLLKLESLNPTLSFKDRAMALGAAFARSGGYRGLALASTGNAAVSASAYAAAAGLECRVVIGSASQAARKLDACRAYGAEVLEIEGDYSAAYARARELEGEGWLNVSTTYRNPVLAEGYRPLAAELLADLGEAPGVVVVPVGAGPLLRGIERGFADLRALGAVERLPRMVGVQAAGVAPLARAWASGLERVEPWVGGAPTAATAIADALRGYEEHGDVTLAAVRRTGGCVLAVEEGAILEATRELARAGVWVEPSSATTLAALELLGEVEGPVVLVLTGHGAKAPVVL